MKQFTTALKKASEEQGVVEEGSQFQIDNRTFVAKRPDPALIIMGQINTGPGRTDMERCGAAVDFVLHCVDEEARGYITSRLMDMNDPYDLDDVLAIMLWMIEEWSGNPTPEESDSSQSQETTGAPSTQSILG